MADVSGKFYSATKVRTGVSPSSPGIEQGATLEPVNPPGSAINSVGLTMPTAFNVANSPLTSNGTIAVTGAGTTAEYIRGDGSLASFPSLTGYVPYTGATQNVDLGEFGLDTGFVNLDTTPTNTPTTQGTMYWDDSRSTAALIMNGTLQHIGQDTFFYVKNASGSSIAKGTAVRFDGTDGASGHLLIAPFLANGTYPSNYFMGVTAETIASGSFGQVMHFGELSGINTSGYTAGALLYASTTVAGGFQTTAPVAPNNIVLIAAAINSKNNGDILVRPTYGSNINQDEGVKIVSPTTGQLLQLQANGLWENKTKAQVLGGTSSQFVKGDGSLDSTTYQSTADKGQPNGYASLDSNGKVPLTQINDALIGNVNYQGLWNASTNTPTLANPPSSGTKGYYYIVSTAGTFAGISFEVGDWIISNGSAWQKVDNTDAVSSVFGRTGNVVAANGDYTTAQVTESGNLYYTEARVNANTNVAANTAARHNAVTLGTSNGLSLSTQVLSLGLASAGVTGALSGTDWSTFNSKQNALTNPVTGTGTTNYLPKFTGSTTVGNSQIFDNGTTVGIGTNNPTNARLVISTTANDKISLDGGTNQNGMRWEAVAGANGFYLYNGTISSSGWGLYNINTAASPFWVTNGGNFIIGTTSDAGYKLDVNGTGRFTSTLIANDLIQVDSATVASLRARGGGYGTNYNTSLRSIAGAIGVLQLGNNNDNYILAGNTAANGFLSIRVNVSAESITSGTEALRLNSNATAIFYSTITATSIIRSGGTSSQFLKADGSVDSTTYLSNVTASSPLFSSGGATPNITIQQASGSQSGFLSSTDWTTFNNKQAQLNGTGFVKASGTTISYDNTSYLPLTGGTLTGGLSGTSAFFSSDIQTSTRLIAANPTATIAITASLSGTTNRIEASNLPLEIFTSGSSIQLKAGTGSTQFTLASTGNVCIGTGTPNRKLEVITGSGTTNGIRLNYVAGNTSEGMDITYLNTGNTTTSFDSIYNSNSAIMQFRMKTAATPVTAMTILGSGNVGIGIVPTQKLHVGGSGDVVTLVETASGAFAQYRLLSGATNPWVIGTQSDFLSNGLVFRNVSDRMVITTGGNVLIGTTTDSGAKLQVNGDIRTGTLDTGYVPGNWKLGRAILGTQPTETYQIIVEINGVLYAIGAANI